MFWLGEAYWIRRAYYRHMDTWHSLGILIFLHCIIAAD